MNITKSFLITVGSNILILLISTVISYITAVFLGPEGRGIFVFLLILANILFTVGEMGLSYSNLYFLSKKRLTESQALSIDMLISIGAGSTLSIITMLVLVYFPALLSNQKISPLIALIVLSPLSLSIGFQYLLRVIQAREDFISYNFLLVFRAFIQLGFTLFFIFTLHLGVAGALFAWNLSYIAGFIIGIIIIIRKGRPVFHLHRNDILQFLKYGLVIYGIGILWQIGNRLDIFFIGKICSMSEVGVYSIAIILSELFLNIPQALKIASFVKIAQYSEQESTALICRLIRISLFLLVITGIAVFPIMPFALPFIFGEDYSQAVIPFFILFFGIMILAVEIIISSYFYAQKAQQKTVFFICIIYFISAVFFYSVLIPLGGIIGAAIATAGSYLILSGIETAVFIKRTRISLGDILVIRKEDFAQLIRHILPSKE